MNEGVSGLERIRRLKVRDIMSKNVHTVEVPGHRNDALKVMKEYNVSGIPVVERKTDRFLGLVTRYDIYTRPAREQLAMLYRENVATAFPSESLTELVKRFIQTEQYWLPVLENGKVVGIVTPTDLLKFIEEIGAERPVKDYLKHEACVPVYQRTPIGVAFHILKIAGVPALPVLDDDSRLVGIISDLDIVKLLSTSLRKKGDIATNVEDDSWSWEGIRDFIQTYGRPGVTFPEQRVENVMVRNVKHIYMNSDVGSAARAMRLNDVGQLPVCDSSEILLGIIYNYNLLPVLLGK